MSDVLSRVAAAPISWGVCEVPGWGHQMSPGRVLTEMREVGLSATEFGPDGFLPTDPEEAAAALAAHGLEAVGGFVPVVLHECGHDPLPEIERALRHFSSAGAGTLVLAAATGLDGYDERPVLEADHWKTLLSHLVRIRDLAGEQGINATLHPHVGTVVERRDEVERVLDGCDVGLCLDTGHLLIGGTDPVALAHEAPERIAHTHLKDVDSALAAQVQAGALTYTEAVRAGIYRSLGAGDIDITGIVGSLEAAGYRSWYVMEQDTILAAEPEPGLGPVADVQASLEHLRKVHQ